VLDGDRVDSDDEPFTPHKREAAVKADEPVDPPPAENPDIPEALAAQPQPQPAVGAEPGAAPQPPEAPKATPPPPAPAAGPPGEESRTPCEIAADALPQAGR
jgi:hypothetical protein